MRSGAGLLSDIAQIEQHTPEQELWASYGDAFLARGGVGLFSGTADVDRWAKIRQVVRPYSEACCVYDHHHGVYRDLYGQTAELMRRLGTARRTHDQGDSHNKGRKTVKHCEKRRHHDAPED